MAAVKLAVVGVILAATSARAELERVAPETPSDTVALAGNVLVWSDAKLYLDPADTAETVQLVAFDVPRAEAIGQSVPMRVVASAHGFVQVEAIADRDCTWTRIVLPRDLAKLRLWVKRADLAPVLVKPFRTTFPDGTAIALAIGTPLGRTTTGHAVSLLGTELGVAVPASSVGFAYRPYKIAAVKERGRKPVWLDRVEVTFGDQTVVLGRQWRAPSVKRRGKRVLFPLEVRCMTATVSAAASDLATEPASYGGLFGDAMGEGGFKYGIPRTRVPKGTPLTSRTGTTAVAIAAQPIPAVADPGTGKACVERDVGLEVLSSGHVLSVKAALRRMRLCAPASVVK